MRGRAWTDKDIAQLREWYKQGLDDLDIARLTGRTMPSIENKRRQLKIKEPKKNV